MEVVEELAKELQAPLVASSQLLARIASVEVAGKRVVLACPETFMNRSGKAVAALCLAAGLEDLSTQLLVVHDELDLPPGRLKFKVGGGEAGHNGIKSIVGLTRTADFARLRLGIGRPPKGGGPEFVLSSASEEAMQESLRMGTEAVTTWIQHGIELAMNAYNGQKLADQKGPIHSLQLDKGL
eukprot:4410402-Amphidinium_carterae.1